MLNHIVALLVKPDYGLQLTYDDGAIIDADFGPVINEGGVFSPLADPGFFSSAALDEHGRAVVWPGELEFCADALRLERGVRDPYQSVPAPRGRSASVYQNMIIAEDL